jgi:hypothetical protein
MRSKTVQCLGLLIGASWFKDMPMERQAIYAVYYINFHFTVLQLLWSVHEVVETWEAHLYLFWASSRQPFQLGAGEPR